MDIWKYVRESLGLRDNESRLYLSSDHFVHFCAKDSESCFLFSGSNYSNSMLTSWPHGENSPSQTEIRRGSRENSRRSNHLQRSVNYLCPSLYGERDILILVQIPLALESA